VWAHKISLTSPIFIEIPVHEQFSNKIKIQKQKYHTFGTHPKSNIKIEERDEIDTLNSSLKKHNSNVTASYTWKVKQTQRRY
jgi:hypothetical protein